MTIRRLVFVVGLAAVVVVMRRQVNRRCQSSAAVQVGPPLVPDDLEPILDRWSKSEPAAER